MSSPVMRRVLSAAAFPSTQQSRSTAQQQHTDPMISNAAAAGGVDSSQQGLAPLPPRSDLDLERQKRMVRQHRNQQHEQWLAREDCSTRTFNDVEGYRKHALRILVLQAHKHQTQLQEKERLAMTEPHELAEFASPLAETDRRPSTPPSPTGHFNLTEDRNLSHLLSDIDTLVSLAVSKTPKVQEKMMTNVVDQLAKLSLWNP